MTFGGSFALYQGEELMQLAMRLPVLAVAYLKLHQLS
jgi:hypothetical protein